MDPLEHAFSLSLDVPVCVRDQHPLPPALSPVSKQRCQGGGIRGCLCSSNPMAPHRLKPFTSYKFRVKATNDIGDSEFSEESEPLTTLQAGQCPPPSDLFLLAHRHSLGTGHSLLRGGPSAVGGAGGPAGPCVWLPGQTAREDWATGAFAVGSGTHATPSSLICSFSEVPKLVVNPRKPVKGLLRRGVGLSSTRDLGSRDKEEGALGSWVPMGSGLHTCRRIWSLQLPREPKLQPPELTRLSLSLSSPSPR